MTPRTRKRIVVMTVEVAEEAVVSPVGVAEVVEFSAFLCFYWGYSVGVD